MSAIPEPLRALVRAELAFREQDSTDNLYALNKAIDALPPELIAECCQNQAQLEEGK